MQFIVPRSANIKHLKKYHDIECQIIHKIYKLPNNEDGMITFSAKMLIECLKEVGGSINELQSIIKETDNYEIITNYLKI